MGRPALLSLVLDTFLVFFFLRPDYFVDADKNGTYLLSLPAELHGGTTEKFCITFFDIRFDVNIIFVIHNEDNTWNFNKRDLYVKGECRCTEIEVPEVYMEGFYILTVWGFKADQTLLFSQTKDNVKIVNNNTLTFVQTDKYVYVPGQKVNFRVLTTNLNLKSKPGMISEVAVIDPYDIKMKKWSDVANMQGLMSFTFLLAPQTVLGKWSLRITDGNKITETVFEVQKYVLPRFQVTIEPPSYLLLNVPEIHIRVCANQPQGKEIQGKLRSTICVHTSSGEDDGRPCANYTSEICGCHNFTVNATMIGLSLRKYSLKNAFLDVFASVTDSDSRITVNSTSYGPEIKSEHVIVDIQSSEFSFKPGFLYYGKVNVYRPDFSTAPGELVEISAIDYVNDVRLSKNFTTDQNGSINFTINQFDSRTEQFYLEARSINGTLSSESQDHMMYTPIDQKQVKQWFSPGKKYLNILPISDVQNCGENLNVKLLYTGRQQEKITVYYIVLSKSQIVANGQMSYRISPHHSHTKESPSNLLNTIVNNLGEPEVESTEDLSNRVPLPTTPKVDPTVAANVTNLESNSQVGVDKKKKKKRKKKNKNKERKPRSATDFIAELNLNLKIIPEMSPLSYLTVYLLNDDGEMLSDYREFGVKTCFKNQVGLKIPETPLYPGDAINFELTGSIQSYCALNLVDKSTFPGWDTWITKDQVFKKLKDFHYQHEKESPVPDKYCQNVLLAQQHGIITGDYRGKRGTSVFSSKYVDAIYAFQASGLVLLTDISLESRPCSWIDSQPSYGASETIDELWENFYNIPEPETDEMKIEDSFLPEERYGILDYFPEPWLWQEVEITANDSTIISTKVPYPSNEWTGNVFCSSETDGLGLLPLPLITIFQPFSVSYIVPYTCIAGERIPVSITVESNVKSCLSIKVNVKSLNVSKNTTRLINGPDLCICNEEESTTNIYLDDLVPGSVNLTVLAVVVETPNKKCTVDTMEKKYFGKTDISNAIIEVKAPGFQQEIVHSEYVCPRENDGGVYIYTITSKIPPNVIPDSIKAQVFMFGNMLWPGIDGLDNWIKDPITNGEGNLLSIAAIIYVMDYLNAVGLVSYKIESKVMAMMERIYQQQMNYIHDEGSYSMFGIHDNEGSELLTAFAIQILVKARAYIYVDDRNLQKSISWLRSQQQDDGCFFDKGDNLKTSKYENKENKLKAIHTAKVLISFLEFGTPHYDAIVDNGFKCLRAQEADDLYMMSLYGYAFSLYGLDEQETDNYRRQLETKSTNLEGNKYWIESERPGKDYVVTSLDIETTSYALLALLGNEVVSSWQDLKPIVHWLNEQRKPMSGFVSSRDSMIAFHAITNYALMWSQRQELPNLEIKILDGLDLLQTFHISEQNPFNVMTYTTNSFNNKIRVEADGYGCGMIQTSLSYNMNTVSQVQSFHLHIASHYDHSSCAETMIRICGRYTGTGEKTNVAIMEIRMVTGWIPQQILEPKDLKSIGVKKHEMTEDNVYLYFDQMNKTDKCVVIKVEQVLRIHAQPATVFIYDYYDRHVVGYAQYKLKTRCGTKQELPDVTEEEYYKSLSQARQPPIIPDKIRALLKIKKTETSTVPTLTTTVGHEKLEKTTTMILTTRLTTTRPTTTMRLTTPTSMPKFGSTAINSTRKEAIVTTLLPEHIGSISVSSDLECPKCLDKVPDEYQDLFCRATEVYKVASGKLKESKMMKIIADLRPSKKVVIDKRVVPVLKDVCNCPALRQKAPIHEFDLGANPSSKGMDPFYELPLPISMPSMRGCRPWRLAVDGRHLLLRFESEPVNLQDLGQMNIDHKITVFPLTTTVEKNMRQLAKSCTR